MYIPHQTIVWCVISTYEAEAVFPYPETMVKRISLVLSPCKTSLSKLHVTLTSICVYVCV